MVPKFQIPIACFLCSSPPPHLNSSELPPSFFFKVWHFRCACRMHNEGNATGNAQLYCVYCDSSYMFRLCKVAVIRLVMSEL